MNYVLLLVIFVCTILQVAEQTGDFETKKYNANAYLRKLDSETSDDSLVCFFTFGQEQKDCKANKLVKKHFLMGRVQQYWHVDHYIEAKEDTCVADYAQFYIDAPDDPVLLPCDVTLSLFLGTVLGDRKADALAELRNLEASTSDDNLSCFFKWTHAAREACRKKRDELKHTLVKRVQQYWKVDKYISPDEGDCVNGYGSFSIGAFNDPTRLPCDESAFTPPKHTDKEVDEMYRTLLKMYNEFDKVCLSASCKEKKDASGKALAEKIKYAEDEDMIPRKCQKGGTGWYSFYQGMQEVECPCIPPESTGSSGTATGSISSESSTTSSS